MPTQHIAHIMRSIELGATVAIEDGRAIRQIAPGRFGTVIFNDEGEERLIELDHMTPARLIEILHYENSETRLEELARSARRLIEAWISEAA